MLLLAGALIAAQLPAFTLNPSVNHDEIMLNVAARGWLARGVAALTPLSGLGRTYATAYYWHPPGHWLVMVAAYRLFGFSLVVTRGVSLLSGAGAVVALFVLLRRMNVPPAAAASAAALLIANPVFWWICRSGRMDAEALGIGLVALIAAVRCDGTPIGTGRAVAAGLLIGLASLFHVMVLVWAPALVAAEAFRTGRFRWSCSLALGAAAALPLIGWVAFAFARGDGAAWEEQFLGYQLGQRSASGALWLRPWAEMVSFVIQTWWVAGAWLLLVAGLCSGWAVRLPARHWAMAGAGVAMLAIAFATSKGTGANCLYWLIWALLAAAPGIAALGPRVRCGLVAVALCNLACVEGAFDVIALIQRRARDPARIDGFLQQHVRPGTVVLGPEEIWYAVEHAGAQLRIWEQPDPRREDYYVTYATQPLVRPRGFTLVAELPDVMPRVLGHYGSTTPYCYRLWAASK